MNLSGIDACDECVAQKGLCGKHARGVLPQLAQPFWYRLVGSNYDSPDVPSPQAVKKAAKREHRRQLQLAQLFGKAA